MPPAHMSADPVDLSQGLEGVVESSVAVPRGTYGVGEVPRSLARGSAKQQPAHGRPLLLGDGRPRIWKG